MLLLRLLLLWDFMVVSVLEPCVIDAESLRVQGLVPIVAVTQDGRPILSQIVSSLNLTFLPTELLLRGKKEQSPRQKTTIIIILGIDGILLPFSINRAQCLYITF